MFLHRGSNCSRVGRALLAAAIAAAPSVHAQDAPAVAAPHKPPEIVLARVDGEALTLGEALDVFLSSHSGHGVLVRGEPAVRELAGRLVERALFLSEAQALEIPADAEVLEVVGAYRRELAADEYWKREVKDKVVVSDEEVESFYAKTDVALRLTVIETAEREAAQTLRAKVEAGEDMGALARTQSIHPSRTFDGSLSYVRRGELPRALEEAAFALEASGGLTAVIPTEKGFAFLRLEERSLNPDRPPRETALPQIRGILEERLSKRLAKEVEERALAEANVVYDDAKLTRATLLESTTPADVVVRAAGDSLTIQDLRDALDLDALRSAAPEQGEGVARRVAEQWARAEALKLAAAQAGLLEDPTIASKTARFSKDVVMKVLCRRYVWPQDEPSDAEVRAYYDEHKAADFTKPPEVRLAYIVTEGEEAARSALARLAQGEEFEALAREVSKDAPSAMHGGRIGWIKQGELLEPVELRAFALEIGVVDGPIATDVGHFILKALDRKEAQVVPFAQARATALKRLVEQRQRDAYAKWALALRERADVELDEAGVRAAVEWLDAEAVRAAAEKAAQPAKKAGAGAPPGHGPRPDLPGTRTPEKQP